MSTLEPIPDVPGTKDSKDLLSAVIDGLAQRIKADSVAELVDVINKVGERKPQPPATAPTGDENALKLPDTVTSRGRDSLYGVFSPGQIQDMRDLQYRQFSPDVRKIRNPRVDQYIADWFNAVRNKDGEKLARFDLMERAVISEGSMTANSGLSGGTAGGLIPLPLSNLIILVRNKEAVMRSVCTTFQSPSLTLRVPKLGTATVYQVAEGSAATVGEPASTSVLMSKKKTQFRGQFSEEAVMDSAFNLVTILSERGGSAFAQNEDVQAFQSDGTGANWTGSVATPNSDSGGAQAVTEVAEASSGVLTYEDVVKLYFTGLTKANRSHGVWFGNETMMQYLSTIEDAQGRTIFQPMMSAPMVVTDAPGQVGTIFGRPVYEVPLAAGGSLYFMDPKRYAILEGERMAMKTTDAVGWTSDYIDFKVTVRQDGALLDNDAYSRISGITSVA